MKRFVLLISFTIAFLFVHLHSAAQDERGFRVIVHPDNPVASMTKVEVSRLFLKRTVRWDQPGIGAVDPVDLEAKSDIRAAFSGQVHGRSVANVKNYWQKQIFSGRSVPPPELAGESDVLEFVRSRPGAIGYVSAGANLRGVKVLQVTD